MEGKFERYHGKLMIPHEAQRSQTDYGECIMETPNEGLFGLMLDLELEGYVYEIGGKVVVAVEF